MLQPFDGKDHDTFPAPDLNNYSREMRDKQTNFLAFNKTMPKYMAVEYAKGQGTDWAAQLDDTFAKKGVWQLRYGDVANPYAAGVDYNRDMGGPDIFKIKPDSAKIGTVSSEYMSGSKKFMGLPVKKEKAGVADYIKATVGGSKRFNTVKPMAYKTENAYETYGYKEYGLDKPEEDSNAALAMFMRSKANEKETAAFKHDSDYCPPGNTWVNGECIPIENKSKPVCPFGWRLNSEGRCQLMENKEFQDARAESTQSPMKESSRGGINTDMKKARAALDRAGRDAEHAARNIGQGMEDVAKRSWGAAKSGASKAYTGVRNGGKAVVGGSEDMVKQEGSVMAHDIYKATHKEKMIAVEDVPVVEKSTGESESPVYSFFFQEWTTAQSFVYFLMVMFLILLVVFFINYARRSPMRKQAEYEQNRLLLKNKNKTK